MGRRAQAGDGEIVRGLRIERKEEWPNESLVSAVHFDKIPLPTTGKMPGCRDRLQACLPDSFADAELAKYGIEDLFDIDRPDYFADGA